MTGKRTNQYEVDPGSPANSDNRDGAHDEKLLGADKAKVAQTRTDEHKSMIPQRGKNPALEALQARREAQRAEQAPPAQGEAPAPSEQRDEDERAVDAERTE
jgi:hypothetical protein